MFHCAFILIYIFLMYRYLLCILYICVYIYIYIYIYYPHTLVPKVFGQITETCRLARHLIIDGIKMIPRQNVWIAKQVDY